MSTLEEVLASAFRNGVVNAHLTKLQRDHVWTDHTLPRLLARLKEDPVATGPVTLQITLDDKQLETVGRLTSRAILLDLKWRVARTKVEIDEVLVDAEPGPSANYLQGKSDTLHTVIQMIEGALKTNAHP